MYCPPTSASRRDAGLCPEGRADFHAIDRVYRWCHLRRAGSVGLARHRYTSPDSSMIGDASFRSVISNAALLGSVRYRSHVTTAQSVIGNALLSLSPHRLRVARIGPESNARLYARSGIDDASRGLVRHR